MKYLIYKNISPDFNTKTPSFVKHGTKLYSVKDKDLIVHIFNNQGNDAGFGWLWVYNVDTRNYEYKMSIFDGRLIDAATEVPFVGLSNNLAYEALNARLAGNFGLELSFKGIWKWLKGFVNGIFAKFRRRSNSP